MEAWLDVPLIVRLAIACGFGLIIGSFLNVVIYRLHTGKSLAGHSHCLSCATRLRFYELVPVLSYLALRGRCRTCRSWIPSRYFLVEVLTGGLFMLVVLTVTDPVRLLLLLSFVSILVVIAVYDLYHYIVPDEMTLLLTALAMLLAGYQLLLSSSVSTFFYDLLAAGLGSLFLFMLWYVSKGRWIGFGDVKLAVPLGLVVGWAQVFSLIVLSFWIGAVIGVGLLIWQRLQRRGKPHLRFLTRTLTIKSAIPFAPFMILGCLAVLLYGVNVIELLHYS